MEKLISPKGNGLVIGFFSCLQIALAQQDWDVDVILGVDGFIINGLVVGIIRLL